MTIQMMPTLSMQLFRLITLHADSRKQPAQRPQQLKAAAWVQGAVSLLKVIPIVVIMLGVGGAAVHVASRPQKQPGKAASPFKIQICSHCSTKPGARSEIRSIGIHTCSVLPFLDSAAG
jgi:hypothetical protein